MFDKIVLLLTVFSYSIIVSQPFMYMLSLKNTQLALGAKTYTEVRQLIDANMTNVFKYVIYISLLANAVLVAINISHPASLLFLSALIAFIALIAEVILALKGNIPLNKIINTWSLENSPADWREVRKKWFIVFRYRQLVTIAGFMALLIGVIFSIH